MAALDPVAHDSAFAPPIDTGGTGLAIARAREELRTAMPAFREWDDSTTAPGARDYGPVPFVAHPVVGDFDLDGMPDVIFVGHEANREHVVAVLSHRGHATVEGITGDVDDGTPGARQHRFLRLATNAFLRSIAVDVLERDQHGSLEVRLVQYVYTKGHFAEWMDGD